MNLMKTLKAARPMVHGVMVFVAALAMHAYPLHDGQALTPTMGWYPWNQFGQDPQNEALIKSIADAMVSKGLLAAGYNYCGPDEGILFSRDASGKLQSNLTRYPSGMKGLGDYIHSKGMKFMLYTDAGTATCTGQMPGMKGYEVNDAKQFAEWGCDYVKVDWCNSGALVSRVQYAKIRDALKICGRPIVYSICNWGVDSPWLWGDTTGHLWRMSGDICGPGTASWSNMLNVIDINAGLYSYARPGSWNDPDMLQCGMLGLNDAQNRSHFALWCIMASPLILGNDVRTMTAATHATITNKEVIAIDQDSLGIQGRRVKATGGLEIWSKKLRDSSIAVVLFNRTTTTKDITLTWADLGLPAGAYYVRDLWKHTDLGAMTVGYVARQLPSYDCAVLKISKNNVGVYNDAPAQNNKARDRLFAVSNDADGFKIGLLSPGKCRIEVFSLNGSRIDSRWAMGPGNIVVPLPGKEHRLVLVRVRKGTASQSERILLK